MTFQDFKRHLNLAYVGIGIIFLFNVLVILLTRIDLRWQGLSYSGVQIIGIASFLFLFQMPGQSEKLQAVTNRLATLMYGLLFLQVAWINLRLLNHISMTTAFPLQDERLAGWDEALGISWLGYFEYMHDHPGLLNLLDLSYTSLTPLSVFMFILLMLFRLDERALFFIWTFFGTAVVCVVIGLFFPAVAAVVHYQVDLSTYENFKSPPGVYHLQAIERLREPAGNILLYPRVLPGLVTFPSFHTAAGIVMCAAVWRHAVFWPVLGYVIVMVASTPIFGGHYFVDLMAGTAVALLMSAVVIKVMKHRQIVE